MNQSQVQEAFDAYVVEDVREKVAALRKAGKATWMFDPEYEDTAYLVDEKSKVMAVLIFEGNKIVNSEFREDLGG